MEDVGEARTPPQRCEEPNRVGKMKCSTGNFEGRQSKDCKIDVGVPDWPIPNVNTTVTYQSCREKSARELWTPLSHHRRLKLDATQLPDNALPPAILLPPIAQQQNNIGLVTTAMEAEPQFPELDASGSAFQSTCTAELKPTMLVPSISPSLSKEPTVAGSFILSVLQELHRLKTIFNGNNEEVRHGPEQSLPEDAGGAQTCDDLSESGDSHSNDETQVSMVVTESGEEICSREQDNIECLRVTKEEASGKMTCANQPQGHVFSLESVSRNDSNEGLCETEKVTKDFSEAAPFNKFESSTTPILKKCRGENQQSPSSPTQIHVGINPFYHHGLQPFKLFEVRKEIQYGNVIMDWTRVGS